MTNVPPQNAIVTGASRGIGRAVALRLARDGFAVVVNYSGNRDKAAEVVAEIEGRGGRATAVQADVADPAGVARLFDAAEQAHGRIGVDFALDLALLGGAEPCRISDAIVQIAKDGDAKDNRR